MSLLFKELLAHYLERVEKGIDQFLPAATTRPEKLHTAIRYSMQDGGKRIRPIILLTAAELFPSQADPLAAAVAIECVHAYSLIHDDLPAIDNSHLRRGRPSCHARFGEATAVLAGDALLTHAFQLLAQHYANQPDLAARLLLELAIAGNSEHLIGGQMEDIENEGAPIDAQTLRYIHKNKTGALITAALKMGLYFCSPSEAQLNQVESIGHHIGMSFQIIDDILDVTSDKETLGKPVGNDTSADKNTYVTLHGIESALAKAKKHSLTALEATEILGGKNRFLTELIQHMEKRTN